MVTLTEIGVKATVAATAAILSSKGTLTATSYRVISIVRHTFEVLIALTDVDVRDFVPGKAIASSSLTFAAVISPSSEVLTVASCHIVILVFHASVALVALANVGIKASVAATTTTSSSLASAAATSSSSEALATAPTAVATSTSL
jgi:hypothetical protein